MTIYGTGIETPAETDPAAHRRYDPLTGEWVLVSAGRTARPWQGAVDAPADGHVEAAHDPDCYLCPGNERAGGARNPDYDGPFVFTNDFAALQPDRHRTGPDGDGDLLRAQPTRGTCRVVCFSPRHDLTLATLPAPSLRRVVDVWATESADLGRTWRWVQVFENRGEQMGASNPHPHGQIWATDVLPTRATREDDHQRAWLGAHGDPLLAAYVARESGGERVVVENDDWLVVVPYWAVWPFETLLVAKRSVARLVDLDDDARAALATTLHELFGRYDALFDAPCSYSMGWHQAPFGDDDVSHWVVHAHVAPPVLRSATVRKHMVGYELFSEAQRDLTAETAAARLRG